MRRGWIVSVPFGDGAPFDLAIYRDGHFLRVQCKTGWVRKGCLEFNGYASDHGHGVVSYAGRADLFGVMAPGARTVYLVPVADVNACTVSLRLEPPRNGQRKRVRFADTYDINAWNPTELIRRAKSSSRCSSAVPTDAGSYL